MTGSAGRAADVAGWPELPVVSWQDTRDTLHLWTQIVGKTKLALSPLVNHWWGVALYVNAAGLTTSLMAHRDGGLEIGFDFPHHQLVLSTTDGQQRTMPLQPRTVADFYAEYRTHLADLGVDVSINTTPVELAEVIPFEHDTEHAAYDPTAVRRFHTSLVSSSVVMHRFRSDYRGKASPVHFFGGAFDLAVTRFSGRPGPDHPGGGIPHCPDWVMREAYSAEVSSCGYWPGGPGEGLFYSYAYPQPDGFADRPLTTPHAAFNRELSEFVLPYAAVRQAEHPGRLLLQFLQETYEAAVELGPWPTSDDDPHTAPTAPSETRQ